MASATIPNSAGPGSSIQLSDVTIAVRDKVIEKFADEPLEKMNESVKMLLNNEEDEQKRLVILAARVYILRQRIVNLSEPDKNKVISSTAAKPEAELQADVATAESNNSDENNDSEWKRLRILEDCEVNGVRFPKTVIIDVKAEDAVKLVESGNAELLEEKPAEAAADTEADASDTASTTDSADASAADDDADTDASNDTDVAAVQTDTTEAAPSVQPDDDTETAIEDGAGVGNDSTDDLSDLTAALAEPTGSNTESELSDVAATPKEPLAQDDADNEKDTETDGENGKTVNEAFIEAPSAAEVTAALEALGAGDTMDITAPPSSDAGTSAAAVTEDTAADTGDSKDEGDPSGGWFEAQQNAEAASKSEADAPADGSESGDADEKTEPDK